MAAYSASDLQTVFSLLSSSLSSDQSLRKPAESALSECDSRPGFCSCLLEIITARDLVSQVDVRLLASVYFKNSINRYWRQRRDSSSPCISSEEKAHLKAKLLSQVREENPQIALQLAVIISKIARIDYPKEWPDLFSILSNQVQTADTLISHRIFLTLYRTLKELSTKRLSSDQKVFAEIATLLFDYCWKCWQSDLGSILQNIDALSPYLSRSSFLGPLEEFFIKCERWLLCSKIVRQLIVFGYPSDTTLAEELRPVKEICPVILGAVQSFLSCYSTLNGHHKLRDFVENACIKLMKVLITVQARHPFTFGDSGILLPVTEFCLNKIGNPEPAIISFEQFPIQCMVLVKSILECKEYKPSTIGRVVSDNMLTLEQRKKNISASVSAMLDTIFASECVILLCNVLIRRYFIFTKNDFDAWDQNPEAFHHDQDMIQWNEKARQCAEAVYIVLFENYRQILGPVVVSILREAMNASPPSETDITPGMLLKDAAYTAVGHVYYELSSYLNFDEWFKGTLATELANCHQNMRIIHRKIAMILGQWASEIKGETQKLVYCSLVGLLQHQDIAVRLASCRSLCFLIQDCNFSGENFFDLLSPCLISCFKIIDDCQEFDTKVQALFLISVLIEHSTEKIIPFANQLMGFFQKMWDESAGESLLQIYILAALKNFVCSLGYQSPVCYGMLLPILQSGIDISNPDELNLLEDSVLLWEATLSHAPSMVTQLLDLFPYLLAIMERSFEHLQPAINIIEDYIVLGGSEFLNRHASDLAKLLDGIVGNVNDKGLLSALPIIDILIQLYPREAPPLLGVILQKLIVICLSGDDNNLSKTAVQAASGAVLARVLVTNTNCLAQLTSDPSLSLVIQQARLSINQNVLLCLVDLWLDKVDNVTSLQRKTYALALSVILTLRVNEVIDKLDEILRYRFLVKKRITLCGVSTALFVSLNGNVEFCLNAFEPNSSFSFLFSVCTSVILGGTEDLECSDVTSSVESTAYSDLPCRELRKRQIRASDPIRQISLENMLRENLQTCAAFHGEASFNAVINSIHPTALAQIKQALKMA